jgi:hypothetical protein
MTGEVAQVVAPGNVAGVEIAEAKLEQAAALLEQGGFDNLVFRRADATELPFEDDSSDLVHSNGPAGAETRGETWFYSISLMHQLFGGSGRRCMMSRRLLRHCACRAGTRRANADTGGIA